MPSINLQTKSHLITPWPKEGGDKSGVGSLTVFIDRPGSVDLKFLRKPLTVKDVSAIEKHNDEHRRGVANPSQAGIR